MKNSLTLGSACVWEEEGAGSASPTCSAGSAAGRFRHAASLFKGPANHCQLPTTKQATASPFRRQARRRRRQRRQSPRPHPQSPQLCDSGIGNRSEDPDPTQHSESGQSLTVPAATDSAVLFPRFRCDALTKAETASACAAVLRCPAGLPCSGGGVVRCGGGVQHGNTAASEQAGPHTTTAHNNRMTQHVRRRVLLGIF
jgi:hypothetical protein